MKRDEMMLIRCEGKLLRILEERGDEMLVVDCKQCRLPWWMERVKAADAETVTEEELLMETGRNWSEVLTAAAQKIMQERFTMISGILPFAGEKKKRSLSIKKAAEMYEISLNTVKHHLHAYLVYQDIRALAPQELKEERELTVDEKNMRWALNRFYYTKEQQSLTTAHMLMLKERYCDAEGRLMAEYPSIHQFRYFYRKTRKLETYYISRNGLKAYQRNRRPLLGDGVQEFAAVGVGMLDATICDICLVDDAGHLVGRPQLTACVDAYSSFCYGYSLTWEGGVYSLRGLMSNVLADKKEWCRKFGILLKGGQWENSGVLPGVMVTDKGMEYISGNFEQITELGVKLINLPSYRPELKGPVEKFFDLIQSEYKKHLKGKGVIEADYKERGVRDYRKDACLTMRDFETVILRCILYYNSQRVLTNFPYTKEMLQGSVQPYAASVFEWGKRQAGANLIEVSKERLMLALLPRTTGRFTRSGLKVNHMRYHAEGCKEEYLKGGSVTVAYNPEDVSRVWLLEQGGYRLFQLIERRFLEKTLQESEKLRKECRELVQDALEESLQAKIDLSGYILTVAGNAGRGKDTKIKDIRASRQREVCRAHKDFMKEGETDE